jgi:hypothetical protein
VAKPVIARSLTTLILWNIASRRTSTIVVMNAVRGRFVYFVDGIKRSDLWHWSWSPVKDLGTPKVRPGETIAHSFSSSRYSAAPCCTYRHSCVHCNRNFRNRDNTWFGLLDYPRCKTWTSKRGPLSAKLFSYWLLLFGFGEGAIYTNDLPRGEAHVCAIGLDFGGITECEGGGGWVSRTPFLAGTADYKSAPGKPTSQPPAI